MKSNNFTLQKYSGFAGVFLIMGNTADAQAVYTDIDPDIEIEFNGQTAGVDLDNDGAMDFVFLKTSGSYDFWNGSSTVWRFRRKIWAGPEIMTNSIAGESFTIGAGYGTYYFPYAIEFNSLVSEDLSFQNWGFQTLAQGHFAITFISSDTVWNGNIGDWAPDISSEYLGVHFLGGDDCMHFGWIRCTAADSTNRFIIHDYAYETKCEIGILAGDKVGDTTVEINESNSLQASVYAFDNTVYINLNELMQDVEVRIYDLYGKIVYSEIINNQSHQVKLKEANAAYIVELIVAGNKYTKKVVIY